MRKNLKGKLKILFIAAFLLASLAPLVLMPWFGNQEAESADADAVLKPIIVNGRIDPGFMEDLGNYFSKKFAFRREMVTAGDLIKAKVFGISGQDGVVAGRKGYLFYKDSFNDFLGRDALADYDIHSMAYNIKLIQDELTARGIVFLFTVAPNKNSLYPELMPGRYKPDVSSRNMTRLRPLLKDSGVYYLDLYSFFNDIDEVMYLKGDSHWNNLGASMVTDEIVRALGRERIEPDDGRVETRKDFKGDLYKMLYPAGNISDEQVYYDKMDGSVYNDRVEVRTMDDETGEMKDTDIIADPDWPQESEIETVSKGYADGSLLMIRDSFGNSLTPFMAKEFSDALFLNGTPYDLDRAFTEEKDTVVFETVERNLDRLVSDAPVLSTSDLGLSDDTKEILDGLLAGDNQYDGSLAMELSDSEFDYTYIRGALDPSKTENDTKLYAVLKDTETGETRYLALFRLKQHECAAYVRTEDIPEGEYDLYLAYGNGGNWDVSGKLGSYINEEE